MCINTELPQPPGNDNADEDGAWDIDRIATNSLLCALEKLCNEKGDNRNKSLRDFDVNVCEARPEDDVDQMLDQTVDSFPVPNFEVETFYQEIFDGTAKKRDLQERARQLYEANIVGLQQNDCQWRAFQALTDRITLKKGGLAFLEAPGGTGKTFLMNTLLYWCIVEGKIAASTASTGIAATLLHGGQTTHKQFKLPIPIYKDSLCNIGGKSDLAQYLTEVDFIIIDEGPMLHKLNFECIDRSLREITGKHDELFGGKMILVAGDWCQLLPIVPHGSRARVVNSTLKESELWDDDVLILRLTENMRVKNEMMKHPEDTEFHNELLAYEQWLIGLGNGTLPSIGGNLYNGQSIVEVPKSMVRQSAEDVIDTVYHDVENHGGDKDYFKERLIMAADNKIVNETNEMLVDRLPGKYHVFKSIDTAQGDEGGGVFPEEFLNSLSLSGMPEHELRLKVGAVVILLKNFNIKAEHCNGTRYIIKAIGKYRLVLEKLKCNEDDENKILILPRIPTCSTQSNFPFTLKRTQFPIKLAYAVTFNRAQSQTVTGLCGILLPKNVWTHGQIYVAFSRCGNPRNILVWADQEVFEENPRIKANMKRGCTYVSNVVYKDVLTTEEDESDSL